MKTNTSKQSKQYKIVYNKKNDAFNIQIGTKFLLWTIWDVYKIMHGCAGYIWKEIQTYETKEVAMNVIVELIAEDEREQATLEERQSKAENYKDIIITGDVLKEKFPELLL